MILSSNNNTTTALPILSCTYSILGISFNNPVPCIWELNAPKLLISAPVTPFYAKGLHLAGVSLFEKIYSQVNNWTAVFVLHWLLS